MDNKHAVTRIHIVALSTIRALAELHKRKVPAEIDALVEHYKKAHPEETVIILPHLKSMADER